MTKRILDFNPLTGEAVHFEYEAHSDRMTITHSQDVSNQLRLAHHWATDDKHTAKGMKNDMWHYAHVPNAIILEMKSKHGVDFFDKNDSKRVFHLLNTEYKRFKTTDKHHAPR